MITFFESVPIPLLPFTLPLQLFFKEKGKPVSEKIVAINLETTFPETSADNTNDTPAGGGVHYVDLYKSTGKVYIRRIKGRFQRLYRQITSPLLLCFFLLPWLTIDHRPAMLFDLGARRFHIFWMTFWPQDGILLAWLLIIAAFLLFAVTVWAGRIWCGFSCPQTVWTLMFNWIEDRCEGDRHRRIKLDQQPWSRDKLLRKGAKHTLWLLLSLLTGLTFIGYFYGIQDLFRDLVQLQLSTQTLLWLGLFTGFTYMNAGWLREQVCRYMCPYSRIQSVMYDRDTLLVTYDERRGQQHNQQTGDCVDCNWCVQVCPAGIDIRHGLQADCINCGLCIDACDQVMDKLGKARGLIRYASQNGMEASPGSPATRASSRPRLLRPRLVGYLFALVLISGFFVYSTASRIPLSLDVIRDRGIHLFRQVNGTVENVYTLKLSNMGRSRDSFRIAVEGAAPYRLKGSSRISLEEGEIFTLPVRVRVEREQLSRSDNSIRFVVQSESRAEVRAEQKSSFLGPG